MSMVRPSVFSQNNGALFNDIFKIAVFACAVLLISGSSSIFAQQSSAPAEGSLEYYKALAEKGNAEAQLKLAELYQQGKDVAQNFTEAAKWYKKAAEQGLQEAQYKLGEMYYEGKGMVQDAKEAANWLEKAASRGHQAAKDKLQDIKSKAQDSLKDLNKALDMIR